MLLLALLTLVPSTVALAPASAATTETLFASTANPAMANVADTAAVELGMKFSTRVAGTVDGVRFYKGSRNRGQHSGRLWTGDGRLLAGVVFTNETYSGWQQARFSTPVSVTAGTTYVVSYHAPRGYYSADYDFFAAGRSRGNLTAPSSVSAQGNGVYRYGGAGGFPNQTYRASNYWVDVLFTPAEPASPPPPPAEPAPTGAPTGLRAQGGTIVDSSGRVVRLLGVNHAGPEYACSQGWGFFDGPNIEAVQDSFVKPIAAWKATAVRVPLNEHCWLDVNSNIPSHRRGVAYQKAITDYVKLINDNGMVAILEPHWHAPGARRTANNPMPNRDNSPRFWQSLAAHFKGNPSVVFELVNEPHPDWNRDSVEAWRCWRDGGTCTGVVDEATGTAYQAAGMQELVNAIRSTGADQLILAGGVQYANSLSRWLEYRPTDPMNNLGAAWHVYDFNVCKTVTCFDSQVKPVATQVPLVATEVGPDQACQSCGYSYTGFSDALLSWLNAQGASYQAWTWNRWGSDAHMLTADWSGTPTRWGAQFRDQLEGQSVRS